LHIYHFIFIVYSRNVTQILLKAPKIVNASA